MSGHVSGQVEAGVGTIVLDNPGQRNALTPTMSTELAAIVRGFEADASVRCVLIRGAGDCLCAGADLAGFHRGLSTDSDGHAGDMERRLTVGHLTFLMLRRMEKPVVVAANGITAGAGLALVCGADIVIAAEDAKFTLGYPRIGLSPDGGVSYYLPRMLGERRALELALLGETFSATDALAWGLVLRTVPGDRLVDEASAMATRLAAGPTAALGATKRLIRRSLESSWDEQSAAEASTLARLAATDDHIEGVTAFLEKRRPTFQGH